MNMYFIHDNIKRSENNAKNSLAYTSLLVMIRSELTIMNMYFIHDNIKRSEHNARSSLAYTSENNFI